MFTHSTVYLLWCLAVKKINASAPEVLSALHDAGHQAKLLSVFTALWTR